MNQQRLNFFYNSLGNYTQQNIQDISQNIEELVNIIKSFFQYGIQTQFYPQYQQRDFSNLLSIVLDNVQYLFYAIDLLTDYFTNTNCIIRNAFNNTFDQWFRNELKRYEHLLNRNVALWLNNSNELNINETKFIEGYLFILYQIDSDFNQFDLNIIDKIQQSFDLNCNLNYMVPYFSIFRKMKQRLLSSKENNFMLTKNTIFCILYNQMIQMIGQQKMLYTETVRNSIISTIIEYLECDQFKVIIKSSHPSVCSICFKIVSDGLPIDLSLLKEMMRKHIELKQKYISSFDISYVEKIQLKLFMYEYKPEERKQQIHLNYTLFDQEFFLLFIQLLYFMKEGNINEIVNKFYHSIDLTYEMKFALYPLLTTNQRELFNQSIPDYINKMNKAQKIQIFYQLIESFEDINDVKIIIQSVNSESQLYFFDCVKMLNDSLKQQQFLRLYLIDLLTSDQEMLRKHSRRFLLQFFKHQQKEDMENYFIQSFCQPGWTSIQIRRMLDILTDIDTEFKQPTYEYLVHNKTMLHERAKLSLLMKTNHRENDFHKELFRELEWNGFSVRVLEKVSKNNEFFTSKIIGTIQNVIKQRYDIQYDVLVRLMMYITAFYRYDNSIISYYTDEKYKTYRNNSDILLSMKINDWAAMHYENEENDEDNDYDENEIKMKMLKDVIQVNGNIPTFCVEEKQKYSLISTRQIISPDDELKNMILHMNIDKLMLGCLLLFPPGNVDEDIIITEHSNKYVNTFLLMNNCCKPGKNKEIVIPSEPPHKNADYDEDILNFLKENYIESKLTPVVQAVSMIDTLKDMFPQYNSYTSNQSNVNSSAITITSSSINNNTRTNLSYDPYAMYTSSYKNNETILREGTDEEVMEFIKSKSYKSSKEKELLKTIERNKKLFKLYVLEQIQSNKSKPQNFVSLCSDCLELFDIEIILYFIDEYQKSSSYSVKNILEKVCENKTIDYHQFNQMKLQQYKDIINYMIQLIFDPEKIEFYENDYSIKQYRIYIIKILKLFIQNNQEIKQFCYQILNYLEMLQITESNEVLKQLVLLKPFSIQLKRSQYIGIRNVGNTCFINSILQLLYICKAFRERVILQKEQEYTHHLGYIFEELQMKKKVDADNHINHVRINESRFPKNQQSDAHEYLDLLFDKINYGVDKLIDEFFACQYVDIRVCNNCGLMEHHQNNCYGLIIQPRGSVQEEITSLLNVQEYIPSSFCERCQMNCSKRKTTTYDNINKYLIVTISRFDVDENTYQLRKNNNPITIDETIVINNQRMKLLAMVQHTGSLEGGHYICISKGSNERWFEANDETISHLQHFSLNDYKSSAYVLLYCRENEIELDEYVEETIDYNKFTYQYIIKEREIVELINEYYVSDENNSNEIIYEDIEMKEDQQRINQTITQYNEIVKQYDSSYLSSLKNVNKQILQKIIKEEIQSLTCTKKLLNIRSSNEREAVQTILNSFTDIDKSLYVTSLIQYFIKEFNGSYSTIISEQFNELNMIFTTLKTTSFEMKLNNQLSIEFIGFMIKTTPSMVKQQSDDYFNVMLMILSHCEYINEDIFMFTKLFSTISNNKEFDITQYVKDLKSIFNEKKFMLNEQQVSFIIYDLVEFISKNKEYPWIQCVCRFGEELTQIQFMNNEVMNQLYSVLKPFENDDYLHQFYKNFILNFKYFQ